MRNFKLSMKVDRPLGNEAVMPLVTADGAWYEAYYRYEQRGAQWWAVLSRVTEIMPATTPQADQCRLYAMHADGSLDFEAEAKLRRREWVEINRATAIESVRE